MCIPKFYPPHFKMNIAITSHYIPLYTSEQTSHFIPLTTTSRYIAENIPWPMGWALSPLPSRSSSCTCSLGITFERDRGIFIEAEGGVLAYEVTQAIHHMRVIGHKSETAIGTSAPGRWWIGLWGGVAVQVLLQDHLWVGTGKKTSAKEAFNVVHSRICAHPSAITAHIILAKGVVCRQIEGWIGTSVPIICRWTAHRPHIWNLPNICEVTSPMQTMTCPGEANLNVALETFCEQVRLPSQRNSLFGKRLSCCGKTAFAPGKSHPTHTSSPTHAPWFKRSTSQPALRAFSAPALKTSKFAPKVCWDRLCIACKNAAPSW